MADHLNERELQQAMPSGADEPSAPSFPGRRGADEPEQFDLTGGLDTIPEGNESEALAALIPQH